MKSITMNRNEVIDRKQSLDITLEHLVEAELPVSAIQKVCKAQGNLGQAYANVLNVMIDVWDKEAEQYQVCYLAEAPDAAYIQQFWYPSAEDVYQEYARLEAKAAAREDQEREIIRVIMDHLRDEMDEYDLLDFLGSVGSVKPSRRWATKALDRAIVNGSDYRETILPIAALIAVYDAE